MNFRIDNTKSVLLVIGIMIFFFVSVFGVIFSGLSITPDGTMITCPFMDMEGGSVCHMSLFEHISVWQGAFQATIEDGTITLALLILVLLLLAFPGLSRLHQCLAELKQSDAPPRGTTIFVVSLYQELFARGILNSKLF